MPQERRPSSTRSRRPLRSGIPLVLLLAACGCASGTAATLEIEIAPTPDPDGTDDTACRAPTASLPEEVDCVTVTVCRRTETGCEPVRVLRPEDDHGMSTATEIRFPRSETGTIRFDVALAPGEQHALELRAFRMGEPYARGVASGIVTGATSLRVRLEPYERWSCAGPSTHDVPPRPAAPRALHAAIGLPDGNVLLLGGVSGMGVDPTSVSEGAPLQRLIEVYDVATSRFHDVTATDTTGLPGFGVVFHQAFFLRETADGRYVIRVIGGFTSMDEEAAARFDSLQGLTQYGSPLLPAARAVVRDSVDVTYDPARRAADIVSIEPGRFPRAGFDAVSDPDSSGLSIVALGLTNSGGTDARPVPVIGGTWYTLAIDGTASAMSQMLATPRLGATASSLGNGTVLVWGGNVTETDALMVPARAGEILGGMGGLVAGSTNGMPPGTALHTATPIEGGILIAGGLQIAQLASMSGGISITPSAQPLTVVTPDTVLGVIGTPVAVDPLRWPTPILHAAAALPDGSVILAGGALRQPLGMGTAQLFASRAVIRVSESAGTYVATPLPDLIVPRWGAAIAPLGGNRALITGGFVREGGDLRAWTSGEVLLLDPPTGRISSCGTVQGDAGPIDAGPRDAAPLPEDATAASD